MKPYYEDAAVQLFHGDCREILPQIGSVDLVLTDPPYGIGSRLAVGVLRMSDQPCTCPECVLAGCTRPPVTLAASGRYPQRELHGRDLQKFYAERDERKRMFEYIKAGLKVRD